VPPSKLIEIQSATSLARRAVASAVLLARRVRIVSYQNSGRTWLRVMLADLDIPAKFTHAGAAWRFGLPPAEVCRDLDHHRSRAIVFLARHPLDAIVSNYFQATRTDRVFEGSLGEFVRDPQLGLARLLAFNAGWYAARERFREFHLVSYEAMTRNTAAELARIVAFLRIPFVGQAEILRSAAANQFDRMKRREMSGELYQRFGDRFTPGGGAGDEGLKVRRGVVGGWQDYLDVDDAAFCTDLIARSGYPRALLEPDAPPSSFLPAQPMPAHEPATRAQRPAGRIPAWSTSSESG
jgi:hypothetical protein